MYLLLGNSPNHAMLFRTWLTVPIGPAACQSNSGHCRRTAGPCDHDYGKKLIAAFVIPLKKSVLLPVYNPGPDIKAFVYEHFR